MEKDSVAAQHAVEKRSSCSPVPIDEGMYGLKLGMGKGGLGERIYLLYFREGAKISQAPIDTARHGWDKERPVRTVRGAADPYLFGAQFSCKIEGGFLEELAVNLPNAVDREVVFEMKRAPHGVDIPRNHESV